MASPSLVQPALPPAAPSGQSLIGALPLITKPPHSPRVVSRSAWPARSDWLVSTTGAVRVPLATMLEPREITRKSTSVPPKTVVPACSVRVADASLSPPITTLPTNSYKLLLVNSRSLVIAPVSWHTRWPFSVRLETVVPSGQPKSGWVDMLTERG